MLTKQNKTKQKKQKLKEEQSVPGSKVLRTLIKNLVLEFHQSSTTLLFERMAMPFVDWSVAMS